MATNPPTNGTIQVRQGLTIAGGLNGSFSTQPSSFNAVQSIVIGPSPGLVLATKQGTNVSLAALQTPGVCWIQNLDQTNYVEIGIWDPSTLEFYPLIEMLPGEFWQFRLSRFIGTDIGTGSGTTPGVGAKQLRIKGIGGSCYCNVLVWNL